MDKIYIHGSGCVSPQHSTGPGFLDEPLYYSANSLKVVDADYKKWIDLKLIRRMSRVIKMGVAAAHLALEQAEHTMPDAIITGSAYGCLADTGVFLDKMVQQEEQMLTPTAFIQSTHNTVAGQIALMLACHGYNNTFVHRGFSFEQAVLDAWMNINEQPDQSILVGGLDEITNHSQEILARFGLYKKEPVDTAELLQSNTQGTINGEGAAFFLLKSGAENALARIDGLELCYKPGNVNSVKSFIQAFLDKNEVPVDEIDLVITGRNGDSREVDYYNSVESMLPGAGLACYKHLTGEYPTANAFACWMATNILRQGNVPAAAVYKTPAKQEIQKILIYNHHQGTHHTAMLISAC